MASVRLLSSGVPDLLPSRDRSPGLHHSEVLSDYCIRMGYYPKYDSIDMTRMQLGLSHEDALTNRYAQDNPARYTKPGELWIRDMPITLDLLDNWHYVPEEIKLSWVSSRHDPLHSEEFERFRCQVKGQCLALETNTGRLNITHMRGDYKGNEIHHNVWEYEFTDEELLRYEDMIIAHRDRMLREGWKQKQAERSRK